MCKNEELIFGNDEVDGRSKSANSVYIMLPLSVDKPLRREVLFNKRYHAVLSYELEKVSHRDRNGMCDYSTFSIIDIVPIGEPFYRETSY